MFDSSIAKIIQALQPRELKNPRKLLAEYKKYCSTYEERIQYVQFELLLASQPSFVFDIVSNAKAQDLSALINKITKEFDKDEISSHTYAHFIYAILTALNVSCDKADWINPVENNLDDTPQRNGYANSFGVGTFQEEKSNYTISSGKITSAKAIREVVTIPNGAVSIGENVFSRNSKIKYLFIPKSMSEVPAGAFSECSNLNTVVLAQSVTKIANRAFCNAQKLDDIICEKIQEVGKEALRGTKISSLSKLPGLISVGERAFAECQGLKSIDGMGLQRIGAEAFFECKNVFTVSLASNSENLTFTQLFNLDAKEYNQNHKALKKICFHCTNGEIPAKLFANCEHVEKIEIVGKVTKIGEGAFFNCKSLKELKLDYAGAELPSAVFANCESLVAIPLMKNVTSIGLKAFKNCSSLQALKFDTISNLGEGAFANCVSLSKIEGVFSIKELPANCFEGCKSLTDISFLHSIEKICANAFAGMVLPRNFVIPSTVKQIEGGSFAEATFAGDGNLILPASASIEPLAFENARNVKNLLIGELPILDKNKNVVAPHMLFSANLQEFNSRSTIVNVKIQSGELTKGCFEGWEKLEKVNIEAPIQQIPDECFKGCSSLEGLKINVSSISIGNYAFANCVKLNRLRLASSPQATQNEASLNLSNVDSIGKRAFENCTSIRALSIVASKTFGENAFFNCTGIEKLAIMINSTSTIRSLYSIFESTASDFSSKFTRLDFVMLFVELEVPESFFEGCTQIKTVKLRSNSNITIGKRAFFGCGALEEIKNTSESDPSKVECNIATIKESAFENCYNLNKLPELNSIDVVEQATFKKCKNLQHIKLASCVKLIDKEAFFDCQSLEAIDTQGVEKIGSYCFSGCQSLSLNNIVSSLKSISSYALAGIRFPNDFKLSEAIEEIDAYAFDGSSFASKSLVIPNAKIERLAFANTSGIEILTVNSLDITNKAKEALKLHTLFTLDIQEFNNTYSSIANLLIASSTLTEEAFLDWRCVKKIVLSNATDIPKACFKGCSSLEGVRLYANEISIQEEAFAGCTQLKRIMSAGQDKKSSLDGDVMQLSYATKIGKGAFDSCQGIQKLEITSNAQIDSGAFSNCTQISELAVKISPKMLSNGSKLYSLLESTSEEFTRKHECLRLVEVHIDSSIPDEFFDGCTHVEEIKIVGKLTQLGKSVFKDCRRLKELELESSITVLPEGTFENCYNLERLSSLDTVSVIEQGAFKCCRSLEQVELNSALSYIGKEAFSECTSLKELPYEYKGEELFEKAFSNCKSLVKIPTLYKLKTCAENAFEGANKISIVQCRVFTPKLQAIFADSQDSIEAVVISSSYIPRGFINNFKSLLKVYLTGKNVTLSNNSLSSNPSLREIEGMSNVIKIGDYALSSNPSIIKIDGIENVTEIGDYAFANCSSLNKIDDMERITKIGNYAFAGTAITSMTIKEDVQNLGVGIFSNCQKLSILTLPASFKFFGSLFDIVKKGNERLVEQTNGNVNRKYYIPSSLNSITITTKEIPAGALSGLPQSITILSSIEKLNDYSLYGCTGSLMLNADNVKCVGKYALANCIFDRIRLTNVERIEAYAFNKSTVNNLHIGKSISYIDKTALSEMLANEISLEENSTYQYKNYMLTEANAESLIYVNNKISGDIVIPDGIKVIEGKQFKNCDELVSIRTNQVEMIEDEAFYACTKLSTVIIDDNVQNIGKYILNGCDNVKALDVPFIGETRKDSRPLSYLFKDSRISSPSIIVRGGEIEPGAFDITSTYELIDIGAVDCEVLEQKQLSDLEINTLILPKSLEHAHEGAFSGMVAQNVKCDSEYIEIFENSIYIANKLIYHYASGNSILIKENTSSIADGAFKKNHNEKELVIEQGVSSDIMKSSTFKQLDCIETAIIKSEMEMPFEGFINESVKEITYYGSNIFEGLFANMKDINEINLPATEAICENAFSNSIINRLILSQEISQISEKAFTNASILYLQLDNSEGYELSSGMLVDLKTNKLIYVAKATSNEIEVPSTVSIIMPFAFSNCVNVTKITVDSASSIGEGAFKGCVALESVAINNCDCFGQGIFEGCSNLKYITLPYIGAQNKEEELKTMSYFFASEDALSNIIEITLINQKAIAEYTFSKCTGLKKVNIPSNTIEIKSYAFNDCESLCEIDIPKGVAMVRNFAFQGVSKHMVAFVESKEQVKRWDDKWNIIKKSWIFKTKVKVKVR